MRNQKIMIQLLRNREDMYRLLGRFFAREADTAFLQRLPQIRFPDYTGVPGAEKLAEAAAEFQDFLSGRKSAGTTPEGQNINALEEELAVDYARTFLAAGIAKGEAAFPYESVYTSKNGITMQEAWEEIRRTFQNDAIEMSENAGDLEEDHIAMELEYMAWSCDMAAEEEDIYGCLRIQMDFLENHLLNWVPRFNKDIKKFALTAFYPMAGDLLEGWLEFDQSLLASLLEMREQAEKEPQSFQISHDAFNRLLTSLKQEYRIFAPKRVHGRIAQGTSEWIRYDEISSADEIVNNEQSYFSPKEVFYPISQTTFTFDRNQMTPTIDDDDKGVLIFARPCDIEGTKRLDKMFLVNGGNVDIYYKTMRDKVHFILLECPQSWENCCCVSMGSNRTENYSMAVRLPAQDGFTEHDEPVSVQVKDPDLYSYFEELQRDYPDAVTENSFSPRFIQENKKEMRPPEIDDPSMIEKIYNLDFWQEYNDKCISCGGCNAVCITCSCFETVDFMDQMDTREGTRRRVWSPCMIPEFSMTAGGHMARPNPDKMTRFKTMHKVYDYKKRFGDTHMCVGCGRCTRRCPEDISFIDTVNRLHDEVEKLKLKEEDSAAAAETLGNH